MKKSLLTILTFSLLAGASAQNAAWKAPLLKPELNNLTYQHTTSPAGNEPSVVYKAPVGPVSNAASTAAAINETVIGTTTYDLQSNAGMQRRLIRHANGEMSAVWTWSPNVDATWATRGTGYNFFDGTNWGANPTAAIESIRTGWPSISILNGTDEVVFSHDPAADVLVRNSRNGIGSGTWNQAVFTNLDVQLWNKVATGGPGDNTLHVIGLTAPTGGTAMGTLYQGLDGALLYNRSFDNGATWNIQNLLLPGIDTFNFIGLSADAYSIDARGNTIAVVQGAVATGVQLWKSTDNGSTWTMTEVLPQDVPKFDETVDFVDGTVDAAMRSSGGSVHVLLDNNDNAHVFYGNMLIANPTVNDGNLTFFPGTNGIMYWNEDFGKLDPVAISGAMDQDGDGTLNSIVALASYGFKGLSSYPTAGIDANGDVYVVFSAIREDLDNSIQTYRHIFGITTADDGCSWSEAVDLTGSAINDFSECVFPSMARRVDNQVHLVYQKDFEPGIAVNGDMDATTNNDIVYLEADLTDFSSTLGACPTGIAGDTLFCAGGGSTQTLEAICGSAWNWSTGETTQSISVNTTGTFIVTTTTPCGTVTDTLVVVAPGAGPNVTIQPSANELCPGDAGTLTASVNVAGTNFLWSTGATSATTNINAPGTYTVTATNCGGSTVSSITITQPTGPPAAVINGPVTICTGQTITLTAQTVTGGSYLWSTGDVTTTTSVSAAGTYTVTVTNCGGTSTATTTVTTETLPTAQVTAQGGVLTACEGDNVTLIASGGASYVWSNGDTNSTITLNDPADSGPYTVTVSNNCGDTDVSTSVTVTINANPAAPVVTVNGGTFTSSASGTHTWFINGVAQSETGPSFTPTNLQSGDVVTVQVTDGNGCTSPVSDAITSVEPVDVLRASLNVFPNPNDGQFAVYFNNADADSYTLNVRNVVGQVVYTTTQGIAGNHIEVIDLSNLSKGMYFLTVTNSTAETSMKIITR